MNPVGGADEMQDVDDFAVAGAMAPRVAKATASTMASSTRSRMMTATTTKGRDMVLSRSSQMW